MAEPIVATLNIVKASILTIDTADLYLQLSQPADYILFSVTYNPNVFAFLPDSVQCALPLSKTDTSTPGVVSLKFESNALDATADVVRFSFRPLMAVTLSGFIVNNLSTNPKSTLKVPTVNVSVQRTEISSSSVLPLNPDIPPVGMPLPVPPFALPPLPVPPPAPPVPPAGDGDTNNAVLGIGKPFIYTIQTADLYLQLDKPASSIQFNVTYDPNVFRFLPGSVQCALPWSSLDTSKPGIVGFKFMSQGESVTATVVSFSFAPLMAVPRAGFIANGLVTNTGATHSPDRQRDRGTHRDIGFPCLTVEPGYPARGHAPSCAALGRKPCSSDCAARWQRRHE